MRSPTRFGLLALCLTAAACSTTRPLPKFEKPLARSAVQNVRTTAYTDSEADHRPYGAHSAMGGILAFGPTNSAAADWSRWPAGTVFRIRETGELYRVDDYGWALAGTNTIDLYKPSREAMNAWGVHRVNIEILHWGNVWDSYTVLQPRTHYAHVRRMIQQIVSRYPRNPARIDAPVIADATPPPPISPPSPAAPAAPVLKPATTVLASTTSWPKAAPATRPPDRNTSVPPTTPSAAPTGVASNPFYR